MFNSTWNPPNRFAHAELEWEVEPPKARLEILEDDTRGVLARNSSPDIGFDWSLNPYRGCTHACAYCFARTFHELLGYGAGSDFERRLVVKVRAPELLRAALEARRWKGELIALPTATDGYQPLERRYEITRRCLEVLARYRNPVSVVTRSPLVLRDLDILQELARHRAVGVTVSIPILDAALAKALEPGAPPPSVRLRAIRGLREAGVPVGVSVAPVIPGVSDDGLPRLLEAARESGAQWAWLSALRLPGSVAEVFARRLRERLPDRAASVLARIDRDAAHLTGAREQRRGPSQSAAWRATCRLFEVWNKRLGFAPRWAAPDPTPFRRPGHGRQLGLFTT